MEHTTTVGLSQESYPSLASAKHLHKYSIIGADAVALGEDMLRSIWFKIV